ncbi:hypothetical protein Pfo_021793 [Paulownia fortunei]|nr:hypothetical protein Pfo_021793 [Paulownia fortunei]
MSWKAVLCQDSPNEVPNLIINSTALTVSMLLVFGSRSNQAVVRLLVELGNKISRRTMGSQLVRQHDEIQRVARCRAIHYMKRAETNVEIDGVIMCEFNLAQLQIPGFDMITNQAS